MNRRRRVANTVLILGGAGMVGVQVARESVRELRPAKIVISALTDDEVDEAIEFLKDDVGDVELVAARRATSSSPSRCRESGAPRSSPIATRTTSSFDEIFTTGAMTTRSRRSSRLIETAPARRDRRLHQHRHGDQLPGRVHRVAEQTKLLLRRARGRERRRRKARRLPLFIGVGARAADRAGRAADRPAHPLSPSRAARTAACAST